MADIDERSADASSDSRIRGSSSTTFPYYDLEQAFELARIVNDRLGGDGTTDQIAAEAGQTPTSGAFRLRLSAAMQFGLLVRDRERLRLGEIGRRILLPSREAAARVQAFLHVPLYRQLYAEYRGRLLPPAQGLESAMKNRGVVAGQVGRARQAFQRSAQFADLFGFGKDRLVLPPGITMDGEDDNATAPEDLRPHTPAEAPSRTAVVGALSLHPAIAGMLEELPPRGAVWPDEALHAWVAALESVLRVVYRPRPQPQIAKQPGTPINMEAFE